MPNYGSLKDFVMSMGRELFASATRGYPALAKFAEEIGIDTKDVSSIASASDEAIQQVLDRGARQRIIDPRQANAIKIQMAKDAQPTLKVDNPNEDWLASKIRFAERSKENAPPNTYRANLGNSDGVTGYFSKPIEIDPNMLVDVRGSMGEESFRPDARKMQDLRESIAESGYEASPILIHVREDGVPFVVEGNHRIIEGIESGRSTIPVELKYLRGSEDIEDGILSPTNLGVKR